MITSGTDINKYLGHSLSDPLIKFYLQNGGSTHILSLPICPRCERTGLRDKGWALHKTMSCPHCGYHGHATLQMSAYLTDELYR